MGKRVRQRGIDVSMAERTRARDLGFANESMASLKDKRRCIEGRPEFSRSLAAVFLPPIAIIFLAVVPFVTCFAFHVSRFLRLLKEFFVTLVRDLLVPGA
jgi:hypothetical protein